MKKVCSRMLTGFIALVMLVTMMGGAVAEGTESYDLELVFLATGPDTTSGWWQDDVTKTALAVYSLCDLVLAQNAAWDKVTREALDVGKVYVLKSDMAGGVLMTFFFGESDLVGVLYTPSRKQAKVMVLKLESRNAAAEIMEGFSFGEYVEIEHSVFERMYDAVINEVVADYLGNAF